MSAPKIPRIFRDESGTIDIYSPNLKKPGGMTTILKYLGQDFPQEDTTLPIDFGIGFNLDDPRAAVRHYLDFIQRLRGGNTTKPQHVIVTHGHNDHVCGIPFMADELPIVVHTTPFGRYQISQLDAGEIAYDFRWVKWELTGSEQIGPFKITYGPTVHSIPQTRSIVIEVPRVDGQGNLKILFMAEFRIRESSSTPGLTKKMLTFVRDNGPYDVILYDALRSHQAGMTTPEQELLEVLRAVLTDPRINEVWMPYIASKVAFTRVVSEVADELGWGLEARGGSMRRMLELGQHPKVGWFPVPKNKTGRKIRIVSGSQCEPDSVLERAARLGSGQLLPDDSIVVFQGAIPAYLAQIAQMYRALARRIPRGFILMPASERRRLKLEDVPNVVTIESFTGLGPIELPSGHGRRADQELLLRYAQLNGPAKHIIGYQSEATQDETIAEEADRILEVEPTDGAVVPLAARPPQPTSLDAAVQLWAESLKDTA